MASRDPKELHPDLQLIYMKFSEIAKRNSIDFLLTCTYRSNEEQQKLYNQGRTLPGPIVTNASAGKSAHNFTINGIGASKAFDIVPLRNGKCVLYGTGILKLNLRNFHIFN